MAIFAGKNTSRQGWRFVRQAHFPCWAMSLQIRGDNTKHVGDQHVTRNAPYVSLTRPNIVYRVETLPGHAAYEEYWVCFNPRPDWMRLLRWPDELPGAYHFRLTDPSAEQHLRRRFDTLLELRYVNHPERDALLENALESILLSIQVYNPRYRQDRMTDDRVQAAIDYLREHYREDVTLARLERHLPLSMSRLAHLFSEQTGMGPMRYLERIRIEEAKALLLSTNAPVCTVAERVGFANPYHFSTRFRLHVGMSPRAFRQTPAAG